MLGVPGTLLLAAALGQIPGPAGPSDSTRPKLLVKDKDYFLHALPSAGPGPFSRAVPLASYLEPSTTRGLVLLHTSIGTGEMKVLAAGGTTVDISRAQWRNNARPDVYRTRIAGVAADKERIYVVRWDESPDKDPATRLLVFRAATGEQVHSLELKGNAVPRKEPAEAAKAGPLQLHADGVTCYGTRFEFKGTRLIKPSKEKQP